MANVKVYFYRIDIINASTGAELSYDGDIVQGIFDQVKENGIQQKGYISIDISPEIGVTSTKPKETLDLFEDNKYVLGRLCKKKDNNQVINRNYKTLLADPVFGPADEATRGIEEYSFFLLDIIKGVLLMSSKRGAPTETALTNISDTFKLNSKMIFTEIPNQDGIKLLCDSSSPEISRVTVQMPVPSAEYLQQVLQIPEGRLLELVSQNVAYVELVLKPENYKSIFSGKDDVRRAVDYLKSILPGLNKAVIKGKSNSIKMTDFDLREQFFSYTIDITKTYTKDGRTVYYSLAEIASQYIDKLRIAYERNKEYLECLLGR